MSVWPQILIDQLPVLSGEVFTRQEIEAELFSTTEMSGELFLPFFYRSGLIVDSNGDYLVDSEGRRIISIEIVT